MVLASHISLVNLEGQRRSILNLIDAWLFPKTRALRHTCEDRSWPAGCMKRLDRVESTSTYLPVTLAYLTFLREII